MGDCRLYWCRPPAVTRGVRLVERVFLKMDMFRVMG